MNRQVIFRALAAVAVILAMNAGAQAQLRMDRDRNIGRNVETGHAPSQPDDRQGRQGSAMPRYPFQALRQDGAMLRYPYQALRQGGATSRYPSQALRQGNATPRNHQIRLIHIIAQFS